MFISSTRKMGWLPSKKTREFCGSFIEGRRLHAPKIIFLFVVRIGGYGQRQTEGIGLRRHWKRARRFLSGGVGNRGGLRRKRLKQGSRRCRRLVRVANQ